MKKNNLKKPQDKPVYKVIKKVKVRRQVESAHDGRNPVVITVLILGLVLLLGYLGINILLYLLNLVF